MAVETGVMVATGSAENGPISVAHRRHMAGQFFRRGFGDSPKSAELLRGTRASKRLPAERARSTLFAVAPAPMNLLSALLRVSFTLIVLGSCSRDSGESRFSSLPHRFFPIKGREHVLLDEKISEESALPRWRVFVEEGESRRFVDFAATRANPPDAAGNGLTPAGFARVFDVPAKVDAEAIAQFSFTGERPSGVCVPFHVTRIPIDDPAAPLDADRALTQWNDQLERLQTQWLPELDPSGHALSYLKIPKLDEAARYVATFELPSAPFSLIGLQVREVYRTEKTQSVARLADARAEVPLDRRVQALRISDDVRRCIVLAPGSELLLETMSNERDLALEVGLACEPNDTETATSVRAQVAVETLDPNTKQRAFQSLGLVNLGLGPKRMPLFQSHVFGLPPHLDVETPVRLRISVEGDCGTLVAEPMLRKQQKTPTQKPNLLVVSIDTLRKDTLGSYGYPRGTTPFLDRFAARGGRFASVTAVAPYTLPTHATIFTGLFPQRHGAVHTLDRFVSERVAYLPRIVRAAGYHTAAFTGGGYVSDVFGFDGGFDRFSIAEPVRKEDYDLESLDPGRRRFREKYSLAGAAEWVEQRGLEPWFLFVHTFIAHEYRAPDDFLARFDSKPQTTPGRQFPEWFLEDKWRTEPASPGDVQHLRDRYDATVAYCDHMLERFFTRLEASGALANTVVVILSDHGEEFFEHGGLRHSITLYEELVQVPWIVVAPSISPATVVKEPVSQADVFPTILELLGLEIPESIDGHSRLPALRHDLVDFIETPLYSNVATQYSRRSALRRGPWKLIENGIAAEPALVSPSPNELFDLRDDPGERIDLRASKISELRTMIGGIEAVEAYLRARAVGSTNVVLDEQLDAQLRQLGYIR